MMNFARLIPANKPKSWVVFALACVSGILCGSTSLLAAWLQWHWVSRIAAGLFTASALTSIGFWIYGCVGVISGRYRHLTRRPWKDQVW